MISSNGTITSGPAPAEGSAAQPAGTPMTQRGAAVVVDRLAVRRGGREVLHGVSLQARAGEITGLLGPSGCGKTTLMRSIVGVQLTESGKVEVLGEPAGTASLRRRVGYVTQAPSVYGDLTVRENVRYFGRVLGVPATRVEETIATVGLELRADQVVGSLSGGERARVSLATALLAAPPLLVLDEPTVGLDPLLRRDIWATFRHLADAGAALLVSSHVMDEADNCDRLVLMRDGGIVADTSPARLRADTGCERLQDAFVALVERVGS